MFLVMRDIRDKNAAELAGLLRERLDAETETFASNDRFRLHGMNGRQIEICQRTFEVEAASEGQAEELAKLKFCESERLCEWSLHADRIQVEISPALAA